MVKKQKKQTVELELNKFQAECLLQALRHPNLAEVSVAVKESFGFGDVDLIWEALDGLETEVCDQISWSLF
jgi:hypothetical protein